VLWGQRGVYRDVRCPEEVTKQCDSGTLLKSVHDNTHTEPGAIIHKEKRDSVEKVCGKAVDMTGDLEAASVYVACEGNGAIK
jgi:ribosome-binding factor A